MSRVIKFRAWANEVKVMHPSWMKLDDEGGRYTLMQFTGLLDKNGKEIYEGDILAAEDGRLSSVEWDTPQYIVRHHPEGGTDFIRSDKLKFTIIGNIYENPNLLTP